jgi:hypothetical protein
VDRGNKWRKKRMLFGKEGSKGGMGIAYRYLAYLDALINF